MTYRNSHYRRGHYRKTPSGGITWVNGTYVSGYDYEPSGLGGAWPKLRYYSVDNTASVAPALSSGAEEELKKVIEKFKKMDSSDRKYCLDLLEVIDTELDAEFTNCTEAEKEDSKCCSDGKFNMTECDENRYNNHSPDCVIGNPDDYAYVFKGKEIEISKFIGFEETTMTIPNCIDGFSVVGIGEGAFQDCVNVEEIIVSSGIEYIESKAFANCTKLSKVSLPNSLKRIGRINDDSDNDFFGQIMKPWRTGAFSGTAIQNIILPESVEILGECSFDGCKSLEMIDLPNGIKEIGTGAFSGCNSLRYVKLPKELVSIGESAFAYCNHLKQIIIPKTTRKIGKNAFESCTELSKVLVDEGLEIIDEKAFWDCPIQEILLPKSIKIIADNTFDWTERIFGMNSSIGRKNNFLTIYCYSGTKALEFARHKGYPIKNASKENIILK